jgi:menaquinone-dependent protoporphyrinogen oxidase
MSRVLVIFGSKHGSTEETASDIARVLSTDGHDAELFPARFAPGPAGYDGVVVGGALYTGRLHPDVRRYLWQHRRELARVRVAVFALGPRALSADDVAGSRTQLDAALAKTPEVRPLRIAVFGGVLDPATLRFPFNRMAAFDARDDAATTAWAHELSELFGPIRANPADNPQPAPALR